MAIYKHPPAYHSKQKDTNISALSALGYPCPIVESCCFCLPLKLGTYIIALLGILPTIVCVVLATPAGFKFLHENGLPSWYCPGIEWIYGILAVIVLFSHILIGVAIGLRLRKLIVLYLWSLIVYMGGSFGIAVVIAAETILSGNIDFGAAFILLAAIHTLILFYFWIVVQSQLYIEKGESNIINIHITIL